MFKRGVPIITTILIGINVLVYVALMFLPDNISNAGVLSVRSLQAGHFWTLITSMFMHGGIAHIACNMVSLFYLGSMSEQVFGKIRYLILYFATGIIGGLVYVAVHFATGDPSGAVGASGAIFGLFGAYGLLLLKERKSARIFAAPTSSAELSSYFTMLAINAAFGIMTPGIANEAHIGGLISGFLIAALMYSQIVSRR